jgi:hypothetical protein
MRTLLQSSIGVTDPGGLCKDDRTVSNGDPNSSSRVARARSGSRCERRNLNAREDRRLREGNGIIDKDIKPMLLDAGVAPSEYHATAMRLVRYVQSGKDHSGSVARFIGVVRCGINGTKAASKAVLVALLIALNMARCADDGKAHAKPVLGTTTAAVTRSSTPSLAAGDSKPCVGWPKRLAFIFDQSKSTQKTRTEHPTVESLDDVIECGKRHGGSIYAGVIRDTSNQPYAHLLLEAEPAKPKEADLTGNALIDMDQAANHARMNESYEKRYRAWAVRTTAAIAAFRRSALSLLGQPADARATDLVTAVERAYVALDEPTPLPWLANAPRTLVIVTDGADTVTRRHVPAAGFPLVLILVNGNGLTGDLGHLHPTRFESFDSMLTYVTGGRHV